MPIQSIQPATGTLIRSFDPLPDDAIRQKIGTAAEAFRNMAEIPLEHRALWMRKLAGILEEEVEELATLITTEMGKPIVAARLEVLKCATVCRYYAANAARMLEDEPIDTEHGRSYVRWEPLGVLLAVMPWNFPFWQVFRFAAPALMAGNVALLKHASNVPQCALALESVIRRAGFPRGSFQTLLIESRQVEIVLADDRVVGVTLTGSEPAGKAVAAQAGWLVKPSVLELGGSDPFVVLASADLGKAVETAVRSRCVNSGQSCIAAKRFLIADEIYDEFERLFVEGMRQLVVGDPMKDATEIGPMATAQLVNELERQVAAAHKAGATLLCGGERLAQPGNYFAPTVLSGLPRSAAVYREEIFGPVALLFRVHDLNEAIDLANDTPFGLSASVWTNVLAEQQRLIAELACGGVFVNQMVASDPRLPFGGIKRSGYGRELSAAGMRAFLNAKTVVIAVEPPQQTEIAFETALAQAVEQAGA